MIGTLKGIITQKNPAGLVLEVGGVGYELEVSMNTFAALPAVGETTLLRTHLAVREDAHILYGFAHEGERIAFRQLIKTSGIGAKTALAILSTFNVAQLSEVITKQDLALLTRVPGIGKKTAERLIVELKDKFKTLITDPTGSTAPLHAQNEVRGALLGLGYKESEVQALLKDLPDNISVEEGVRMALRRLSKN